MILILDVQQFGAEFVEYLWSQSFGEHVRDGFLGRNMLQVDGLVCDVLAYHMVADIDLLGALIVYLQPASMLSYNIFTGSLTLKNSLRMLMTYKYYY